jgi:hypothetical protein
VSSVFLLTALLRVLFIKGAYRSFKKFSEENFVNDLMKSDLDKITEIEDADEAYNKFEEVMVNTINEHELLDKSQ